MPQKKKIIDGEQVFKLASLGCTDAEIADFVGIARGNLFIHRKDPAKIYKHPSTGLMLSLDELMMAGRSHGDISIRRAQFKAMEEGNVAAAIFLGKNRLGQRDNLELTGANGGPVKVQTVNLQVLSVEELEQLYALMEKVEAKQLEGEVVEE